MKWVSFGLLRLACIAIAATAAWWFIFPADPGEAVTRTFTAALLALFVEYVAVKVDLWGKQS